MIILQKIFDKKMKKIRVFIEKGKDGQYSAYMPDDNNLPFGLIGMGKTLHESKEDFLFSYKEMKELLAAEGKAFNEELEFEFSDITEEYIRTFIGVQLRALREAKGLTTRELAELAGLDHSHISKMERGAYNFRVDTLHKVATALGAEIRIEKK